MGGWLVGWFVGWVVGWVGGFVGAQLPQSTFLLTVNMWRLGEEKLPHKIVAFKGWR